jgi:hypothetical protein
VTALCQQDPAKGKNYPAAAPRSPRDRPVPAPGPASVGAPAPLRQKNLTLGFVH